MPKNKNQHMKKKYLKTAFFYLTIYLLSPIRISSQTNDQFNTFKKITDLIKESDSNKDVDKKLIFVSIWSSQNNDSRELNKEMTKLEKMYKHAKLKNGEKGLYFFNYCTDSDEVTYKIALKRDSLNVLSSYIKTPEDGLSDQFTNSDIKNILYNSKGQVVQINSSKDALFKLMLDQLTR